MKYETIRACSIWRALEVVGDVPVLLILEQAFLGVHRFNDFATETGLATSVVSNRLARLTEAGVLARADGRRGGYFLTEKGRDLFPVALMILRWQHRWEAGARGFVTELVHTDCGSAMQPEAACAHCDGLIDPRDVAWQAGPGNSQVIPLYSRRRMPATNGAARKGARMMVDSVIALFGDRWATLVVRACFTGIHRFDDIQRDAGMATNILSDRLARLQAQGIIRARTYSAHQDRFEYRLTEKGRDVYPVLLALLHWGDRWYADAKGPPLLLFHTPCDHDLALKPLCSVCGGAIHVGNTRRAG